MSNTISLTPADNNLFEALWTIINRADDKVKAAIASRIQKQMGSKSKVNDHEQFIKFIDSIPIQKANRVPVDEDGIEALVDMKYSDL